MDIVRLSKERESEILKEVNYNHEQLEKDLELLKTWLREQRHLPKTRLLETDAFLQHFLVGCKGSLENAKKKLDSYYTLRGVSPVLQGRDNIEMLKRVARTQYLWVSPKPLPDGTMIYMLGARDANVDLYDPEATLRRALLSCEFLMRRSGIIRGKQVLIDATGFSAGHALRTPPTNLRLIATFMREAYPIRVKKFIIFNAAPYVDSMINTFVRPFLTEKLQERLIVTKENIDKVFPYMDELPSTYGGKQGEIFELAEHWEKAMETWDYLPNLEEVVDESARPATDKDRLNPYFGLHGSIKALVID
uniref:Alpha-tocopherol transfer protein n=1 Tax=Lygus hesperus TaxID=30085 RepID=A0A146LGG1_LYGHE